MQYFNVRRVASVVVFSFLAAAPGLAQFSTTLTVKHGAAVARTLEPAVVGFAIGPAALVYDPSLFTLTDSSGANVAAQFRSLARWGGLRDDAAKPLRWVEVAFLATVAASGSSTYTVTYGAAGPAGALTVSETSTAVTVTTGSGAVFVVNKGSFTIFDQATLNGTDLLSAAGGIDMRDVSGVAIAATGATTSIEQTGSVYVVIKQTGSLGPLGYTCRWRFFHNRSDPTVEFRLENHGSYGVFGSVTSAVQYFDRLYLKLPLAGGSTTVTTPDGATSVGASQTYALEQDFAWTTDLYDVNAGFFYDVTLDGTDIGSGGRHSGALDVTTTTGGLTAVVDRFWQSFPKSYRVVGSELRIGLWPEFGNGPEFQGQYAVPWNPVPPVDPQSLTDYRFEGGRWKTYKMTFAFHDTTAPAAAATADTADAVNNPFAAKIDGAELRNTFALGEAWMERRTTDPADMFTRYERFWDILVDNAASDNVPNFGRIGLPKFIARGGTNGGRQNYGWENFGDVSWADGYSSLHYDFGGSVLSGFLRTGDYRFFARARDMAAYRRDYGQNHSTATGEWWRGAQFYEKGWWHGNQSPGQQSHTWVKGLLLYYAMTGDEGAREAALQSLDFTLNNPPGAWSGLYGSRIPGWSIEALVDGYTFIGDAAYLTAAAAGMAKYEYYEQLQGGNGYVVNTETTPDSTKPWMENIFFIAGVKYTVAAVDPTYLGLLDRMRGAFKSNFINLASGPLNAITPATVWYQWAPIGGGSAQSIHLCWPMCEALAYSSLLFGSVEDLAYSMMLFESTVRYWQKPATLPPPPGTPVDPEASGYQYDVFDTASFSPITFRPLQYPGSESKAFSNLLHWSPAYLVARAWYDGKW